MYICSYGGALKERRNGRAGKRLSKHQKMDKNKLSTETPQLDFPGKIHIHWIEATCNSRFCVLDVSEQKTYSFGTHSLTAKARPLWLEHGYQGRKIKVSLLSFWFGTEHSFTWRQGWTPQNTAKRSASEMQDRNPQFSWTIFPDKKCTPQNLPMDSPKGRSGLSVLLVDCPFSGKITFLEKRSGKFGSPTDHFGDSKMPGFSIPWSPYRGQNWKIRKMTFLGVKNAFLGVPLGTI